MQPKVHEGRNIKKLREMLGIKQEALAIQLGEDWTQKKVSLLEQKEQVEIPVLERVAAVLNIPIEVIQNFDEDKAIQFINNTINNNNSDHAIMYGAALYNSFSNLNPTEKWLEALEEVKKLNAEKIELYERMLADKDLMIQRLEIVLNKS